MLSKFPSRSMKYAAADVKLYKSMVPTFDGGESQRGTGCAALKYCFVTPLAIIVIAVLSGILRKIWRT